MIINVIFVYYGIKINAYGHANKPEGFRFPHIIDYWRVPVGAVIMIVSKSAFTVMTTPFFYSISKHKDETFRQTDAQKAAANCYCAIYFTFSTLWGWKVIEGTKWIPWWMGGESDGTIDNVFPNNPFQECTTELLNYTLFIYGYHFGETIMHIKDRRGKSGFEEFLLHHIATCSLFFGFTFANGMGFGIVVSWTCDIVDIFISLAKVFSTTHYEKTAAFFAILMTIAQFITRIVWLSYLEIRALFNYHYPEHLSHFNIYIKLNLLYTAVLIVMNIMWFKLFCNLIIAYIKDGSTEDT